MLAKRLSSSILFFNRIDKGQHGMPFMKGNGVRFSLPLRKIKFRGESMLGGAGVAKMFGVRFSLPTDFIPNLTLMLQVGVFPAQHIRRT